MTDTGTAARWWRNPYPWIVLALWVLALLLTVPAPVGDDIRYEAGTHFTSLWPVAETFSHRPLAHRFITEALFRPAWELTGHDRVVFEMVLRLEALVLSTAAAAALWVGLRRRVPRLASPIAVAALAGMVLCSTGPTWEPEWLAVVITVAGVGVTLMRRPLGPILGGVLFAVAAIVKFVSLPIALIGLLAVLLLDQRGGWERPAVKLFRIGELPARHPRFVTALATATVTGIVWLILLGTVWPWEMRWLLDASQMQPWKPLWSNLALCIEQLGNSMIMWPAVALIPAALVRSSRAEKIVVWGALLLAWIPAPAQQQYFPYHLAAFPVIASIALVMGLRRGGLWLGAYALVGGLGSAFILTQIGAETRSTWTLLLVSLYVLYGFAGAWVQRKRIHAFPEERTRWLSAAAALVGVLCLVPVSLPSAGWAVTMKPFRDFSTVYWMQESPKQFAYGQAIRDDIGADTPVLYLAFGDHVYSVGNPTYCKFPTSVFIQRGQWEDPVRDTGTYVENLRCLDDPRNEYLVWETSYLTVKAQPEAVIAQIRRNFDCTDSKTYGELVVCPRR